MSFSRSQRGHPLNQPPPLAEKITAEPITSRTAQSTVTCVYMANISGYWRKVTITWCKNLMSHFFNITIQSPLDGDFHCYTCKVDLKPWHFWSKKGYKSFEIESLTAIDVFWDLRSAKFAAGPEPCAEFYVALVCDEEVVLLVGDIKKKAYKRTKSRPALNDAVLFYKKENVFARRSFSTRAKFEERRRAHDIVVESSTTSSSSSSSASGTKDPEMWISVDGIVVIHVKNLQWKFRGNQTVVIGGGGSNQTVQVFWDVHDWLFGSGGHGLFIFKPGIGDVEESEREDGDGDGDGGGVGVGVGIGGSAHGSDSGRSMYYSTVCNSYSNDFCLFLHAWKIE